MSQLWQNFLINSITTILRSHKIDIHPEIPIFSESLNFALKDQIIELLKYDPRDVKLDIYATVQRGREILNSLFERWTFSKLEFNKKNVDIAPFKVFSRALYTKTMLLPSHHSGDVTLNWLVYSHQKPNVGGRDWDITHLPSIVINSKRDLHFKISCQYRSPCVKRNVYSIVSCDDSFSIPFARVSECNEQEDCPIFVFPPTYGPRVETRDTYHVFGLGEYNPNEILRPCVTKRKSIELRPSPLQMVCYSEYLKEEGRESEIKFTEMLQSDIMSRLDDLLKKRESVF